MPPINDWVVAAIVALTPVLMSVIDWLAATYLRAIPAWAKPVIVSGLGAALTVLSGLSVTDPIQLALIGLACAGIRQVVVWFGRAGLFGRRLKLRWARR